MVSYITLTRLAKAERDAAGLGLERTAGRLGTLRRQLESFKHLSETDREKRAYWAMAKLEDTRNCLAQEIHAHKNVREEHESDWKALSAATKGLMYIGSIVVYTKIMDRLINDGQEAGGLILASAAVGSVVYMLKRLIERAMGQNRFDETVRSVQRLLDECRAGVSIYGQHD